MKRSAFWLITAVAGCGAPQSQPPQTVADTIVIGAPSHRRPQPLNCGTPYQFKICPVPLMAVTKTETLPPILVPVVEIIQIPNEN
jgi:hypothetical protein